MTLYEQNPLDSPPKASMMCRWCVSVDAEDRRPVDSPHKGPVMQLPLSMALQHGDMSICFVFIQVLTLLVLDAGGVIYRWPLHSSHKWLKIQKDNIYLSQWPVLWHHHDVLLMCLCWCRGQTTCSVAIYYVVAASCKWATAFRMHCQYTSSHGHTRRSGACPTNDISIEFVGESAGKKNALFIRNSL